MSIVILTSCKKDDLTLPVIPYFDNNLTIATYPENASTENSYRTKPYLAFNKYFDYAYKYPSDVAEYYKLIFDSTYISDASGQPLQLITNFNSTKDTLFFNTDNSFTANSNYSIKFFYHIDVKRDQNHDFERLMKNGEPFQGTFESSFGIKDYNFSVDTSNVAYAYPWPYQYHFLKDETNEGVLLLKDNQEYDLYFMDATFKVRFYSPTGLICENDVTFNYATRKYKFLIPTESFENRTIYKVEFKMIDNKSKEETIFLAYHFRTSKFNSFAEKINTVFNVQLDESFQYNGVYHLSRSFKIEEPFDIAEGKPYEGLIQFDASIDTLNPWMKNHFLWFYNGLKTSQFKLSRSDKPIGIPPTNNIVFSSEYLSPLLNETQINNNASDDYNQTQQTVIYKLGDSPFTSDYFYIRNKALNGQNLNDWEKQLINYSWKNFYLGNYFFRIKYVVDNKTTSFTEWHCMFY